MRRTVLLRPLCPSVCLYVGQSVERVLLDKTNETRANILYHTLRKNVTINTNGKSTMRFPVSLRWTSTLPLSPLKGAQKSQNRCSPSKIDFTWRKSVPNFLYIKNVSDRVVIRHSLVYLTAQKWLVRNVNIWPKLTHPFKSADFQSIFTRSASAVNT